MGADNWNIFPNWHQPEAVMKEACVADYPRNGISLAGLPSHVTLLDCPEIPMESSQFLERLHVNSKEALAELPESVANYIHRHGLYGISPESKVS